MAAKTQEDTAERRLSQLIHQATKTQGVISSRRRQEHVATKRTRSKVKEADDHDDDDGPRQEDR